MTTQDDPCPLPLETPDRDAGSLVLVSTPIGNLGDMSPRGITALREATMILCEDTRTSARLFQHFGISTPATSLHEHNEDERLPHILSQLAGGARVALISDAGTPLVSDPGYRLVRAAIGAGVRVSAAPGPNAAVMALTLSGLPPHPFLFMGFPPAKQAARAAAFARLRAAERAGLSATHVFYESPHRSGACLADLRDAFGGTRQAALTRELTKLYEEVRRGSLDELAAIYADAEPRGEITIVVGPAPEDPGEAAADLDGLLREALRSQSVRDAAAGVADVLGLPRKLVYARALALGRER